MLLMGFHIVKRVVKFLMDANDVFYHLLLQIDYINFFTILSARYRSRVKAHTKSRLIFECISNAHSF